MSSVDWFVEGEIGQRTNLAGLFWNNGKILTIVPMNEGAL
jgi:hypothetical protein